MTDRHIMNVIEQLFNELSASFRTLVSRLTAISCPRRQQLQVAGSMSAESHGSGFKPLGRASYHSEGLDCGGPVSSLVKPMLMKGLGSTLCRSAKQEEKWQLREARLLDLTQSLIDESGFAHFNMDRLVKVSDVSKGTIYNHFSSKEDCLAAFCVRGMSQLKGLFQRALTFNGTPREIALAIHFAYRLHLQLNPTVCMALVTARTPSFAEKTSPERSQQMKAIDGELFSMAFKVIDDAIKAGELELREDLPEIVITFLNWSMSYGINMLANTGFDHSVSDYLEERNIALVGANVLMDGLGMTPLSKDWDYARTWQRIADEIFAEDILRINTQK
jgi:AcrR family transcriptional regulator